MDYAKRTGSLLAVLLFASLASAQGFDLAPGEVLVSIDGVPVAAGQPGTAHGCLNAKGSAASGLAQQKAAAMARMGRRGHIGGGYGRGSKEGVGWGSSPQAALNACCYSGRRQVVDQGVARGRNGMYYAVKHFR